MTVPIGMRLEESELKEIEAVGNIEHVDRTTAIRKLLWLGLHQYSLERAFEKFSRGEYSLGRAAQEANAGIFEFQEFASAKGYRHTETKEEFQAGVKTAASTARKR